MGLAVVHGIVKNHHGAISVRSQLNVGTGFEVFFPSLDKQQALAPHSVEPMPHGNERILIVGR